MKQENVDINVGSKFDAKGFKQAETALNKLGKTVKSAAGAIGLAYSARAITRLGVQSVKAFAADDKAARVLTRSLDNLGLAFADPAVKAFISDLETQSGVLDDQLRPAFQRLLTTTGDVAKSQQLLNTALDLSAASGQDVVTVAGDLSKGYVGQTRALAKYGLGLTQAELKAMKFEEIQGKITDLFGGQAQVSANSYSGSLDKITVAAANATEILGKGLVEALGDAGGANGLAGSLSGVLKLATAISDLFVGIGRTVAAVAPFFSGKNLFQAIGEYRKITAQFREEDKIARRQFGGPAAIKYQLEAARLAKKNLIVTTKNTKAIKEQTALQKAGTLFDVEQTSIIAALKGKISEDERKRLELQLALITGNTTEASKLAGEIGKAQGLSAGLIAYLKDLPDAKNPFSGWKSYLDSIEAQVRRIASSGAGGGGITGNVPMTPDGASVASNIFTVPSTGLTAAQAVLPQFNVRLVVDGKELANSITEVQTNNSLSGNKIAVNRRSGSFAE